MASFLAWRPYLGVPVLVWCLVLASSLGVPVLSWRPSLCVPVLPWRPSLGVPLLASQSWLGVLSWRTVSAALLVTWLGALHLSFIPCVCGSGLCVRLADVPALGHQFLFCARQCRTLRAFLLSARLLWGACGVSLRASVCSPILGLGVCRAPASQVMCLVTPSTSHVTLSRAGELSPSCW